MTLQFIALLISFTTVIGSIITVWIKLNMKVKELEVKILYIEKDILLLKGEDDYNNASFQTSIDKIWIKLDKIDAKLDGKFEELTRLKVEHDQRTSCFYEKKIKKMERDLALSVSFPKVYKFLHNSPRQPDDEPQRGRIRPKRVLRSY